ncbi:MAG: outer membrane protein transport protein [Thermodesulfobacteriota bacterium]
MKKSVLLATALGLACLGGTSAQATNGDNLMGIGPIARSMGGVGVAAPQDAISAVFANPAAMCFSPYCPGSEFNFAGTVFVPTSHARSSSTFPPLAVPPSAGGVQGSGKSEADPYVIPAIGFSVPVNPTWRFGLAAYGVSGLGVDYRNQTELPNPIYTEYQVMKFAPNLAVMVNQSLSLGASLHVDYANLDLAAGGSHGYTAGLQLGGIYKIGDFRLGASYVMAQKVTHERVFDFDANGVLDDLDLEQPQTLSFGVAYNPDPVFLVEVDAKWLNWSDADGYSDFDWSDQWVFALGVQYKPIDKLSLRAGVNYGENPVNEHQGWNALAAAPPVQGLNVFGGQFAYEYFRLIGFPAVVETHIGLGIGYEVTEALSLNLGYTHAFENTVSETGYFGGPPADVTLESDLAEDSYEFSVSWRF